MIAQRDRVKSEAQREALPEPYRSWVFCDACERPIADGGPSGHGATLAFLTKGGAQARKPAVLCRECLREFDLWLNALVYRGYGYLGVLESGEETDCSTASTPVLRRLPDPGP